MVNPDDFQASVDQDWAGDAQAREIVSQNDPVTTVVPAPDRQPSAAKRSLGFSAASHWFGSIASRSTA